jgi:hypothetical protein
MNDKLTRRDFLRGTACAGLAATLGMSADLSWANNSEKGSRVVLVRDSELLDQNGRIDREILSHMLDRAVTTLFEKEDPLDAWGRVVKPDDIVGIKSNVWGYLPTPEEVEQAIRKRVMDREVPAENIGIDDRGVLRNDIFMNATALINTRPVKTHHWNGMGGCIKNYIMFVPRPEDYHPNSCADLGAIWNLPIVKGKTRLNVLVMITPLFHGKGPHHFNREYTWDYKGLLVGTDPVAIDSTARRILEARREEYFGEPRPLTPPTHHIEFADIRHGIGIHDPAKIELIKLGWQDGVLI